MNTYKYKTSELIGEAFSNDGLDFDVNIYGEWQENIEVSFTIENGPVVKAKFISCGDDDKVGIRIFSIVNDITKQARARVIEACNELNYELRYLRFVFDEDDRDINVEIDLCALDDKSIGPACMEMCHRLMYYMDPAYRLLMKAIFSDEEIRFERPLRSTRS